MKSSLIFNLRERKSVQTESQWKDTLVNTLLERSITLNNPAQNSNERIETVASVFPSRLTLIFRKNISGITQRLGELTLHQDDNLELDPLDFTSTAIERGDALEAQVVELSAKHAFAQQTVSALNQQLEELITAKEAHENALLSKFAVLLNAKKVKIRAQQRLLAQSTVRGPAQQIRATTKKEDVNMAARKPGGSRGGKRKADEAELREDVDDTDEDEEAAFEGPASSVRVKDENVDEDVDGMLQTPDASDEDPTEDEDEGDMDGGGKGENVAGAPTESQQMEVDASPPPVSDLPPDRELPFEEATGKRQDVAVPKQQQQVRAEDEETDDDDDEL